MKACDGAHSDALFSGPTQLTYFQGSLYVTDAANHAVRVVDLAARTVSTLSPQGSVAGAPVPQLHMPFGIAVDSTDTTQQQGASLYVSSYLGGEIFRYSDVVNDTAAAVEVVAGSGGYAFADGVGVNAQFYYPTGLASGAPPTPPTLPHTI